MEGQCSPQVGPYVCMSILATLPTAAPLAAPRSLFLLGDKQSHYYLSVQPAAIATHSHTSYAQPLTIACAFRLGVGLLARSYEL